MAKFCGKIGYATMVEESPGVWIEKIVERQHFGDWVSNTAKLQSQEGLNDDLVIANDLSIVADPYAKKKLPLDPLCNIHGNQVAGAYGQSGLPPPHPCVRRSI